MKERYFGITSLFAGMFFLGEPKMLTGAVINSVISGISLTSVIGLTFFVGGLGLLIHSWRAPIRYESKSIENLLKVPADERPFLIVDESALLGNEESLHELKNYGIDKVFIPEKIRRKISAKYEGGQMRGVYNNPKISSPAQSAFYRGIAKYVLANSGKIRWKKEVSPELDALIEDTKKIIMTQYAEKYKGKPTKTIAKMAVKENPSVFGDVVAQGGFDKLYNTYVVSPSSLPNDMSMRVRKTNLLKKEEFHSISNFFNVENHHFPSLVEMQDYLTTWKGDDPEDIDLLATALFVLRNMDKKEENRDKRVAIYARDVDIQEAIEGLKRDRSFLQKKIEEDSKKLERPSEQQNKRAEILERMSDYLERLDYQKSISRDEAA